MVGFYDVEEDRFFIVDEGGAEGESLDLFDQLVFVHEYVHALQDQHFDLDRFEDAGDRYTDDQELAIKALIEGEAEMVSLLYILDNVSLERVEELAEAAPDLNQEVLERTPPFLRESLVFPYLEGQRFVRSVYRLGGWETVNELWERLPVSTEQILHPEKYPLDVPSTVELPADLADALGAGWTERLREVWGEFQLRLMLAEADAVFAVEGAAGWDGDQYAFLTNGEQQLFVMEIVWDSSADATEGGDALQRWLEYRELAPQTDHRFAGAGYSAFLRVEGKRIFFAFANAPDALDAAVAALGWE